MVLSFSQKDSHGLHLFFTGMYHLQWQNTGTLFEYCCLITRRQICPEHRMEKTVAFLG